MVSLRNDTSEVVLTEQQIKERVAVIGAEISEEYADKTDDGIILVTVLQGALMFSADLARCIDLPIELECIAASSYGDEATSSGEVRIVKDLKTNIKGKHVILVEDILETGLTLENLIKMLMTREPASLSVVVLLRKDVEGQRPIDCLHVGFACPKGFVVGYGLDYAQKYRNLPEIAILKEEVYRGGR